MDYNGSFIPRKTKNIRKYLIFAFFQDIQLKALNVKTNILSETALHIIV